MPTGAVIQAPRAYPVGMLTVMYDDEMPTADELDELAASLLADGSLAPPDAQRVAQVLLAVVAGLRRPVLGENVSDEGFD